MILCKHNTRAVDRAMRATAVVPSVTQTIWKHSCDVGFRGLGFRVLGF